ncbi:MAG: cation transporter [Microbacterium arborescens]
MTERNDLGLTAIGSTASGGGGSCGSGCGCGGAGAGAASAAPSSRVAQEVLVSGMTCEHCVSSVTEELGEIDGVEAVEVDLNVGGLSRVTVHSSGPIDDAALTAAVEEAGYARENALS